MDLRIEYFGEKKGRGVMACKPFSRGEIVEECPAAVIPPEQVKIIEHTEFSRYCLPFALEIDLESNEFGEPVKNISYAIAGGHAMFYNHSSRPNMSYVGKKKSGLGWIEFYALRGIDKDEELTIDYGAGYYNVNFDKNGIIMLERKDFDKNRRSIINSLNNLIQ